MSSGPQDLYDVLGVASTATPAQISHAYRERLRHHHPDTREPATSDGDDGSHDSALTAVLAAYEVLHDPQLRAAYDRRRERDRAQRRTVAPSAPAPMVNPDVVVLGDVDSNRAVRPQWIATDAEPLGVPGSMRELWLLLRALEGDIW